MSRYSFDQTIALLDELYHLPFIPAREAGLERVRYLLERLGNPQRSFHSIHIAGSTGKGSTTAMAASVLQSAGFRTGRFQSPHLQEYTERISVDGTDIGREAWVSCFEQLWLVVEEMKQGRPAAYQLGRPSWFEVMFTLMSLYFQAMEVEWAAVETGLGGRLDATNVLESDVAVVTNVSLEHTKILGKTVGAIAAEKAAIIKRGAYAVTAAQDDEALAVITKRAEEVGAPLVVVGQDVTVEVQNASLHGQDLFLRGPGVDLDVALPLAGHFQAVNAATAFAAVLSLRRRGIKVPDSALHRGLAAVRVPGRLEVVSREPTVLLDGAHNPAGARELRRALDELLPRTTRRVLLFATMADKDVRSMIAELGSLADEVIVTRPPDTERAAAPDLALTAFAERSIPARSEEDVDRALCQAVRAAGTDGVLIVAGSLYLVGFARHALSAGAVSR